MPGVSRHSLPLSAVSVSQNCMRMRHSRRRSQAAIFGVSFFSGCGLEFSTEAKRGALVGPVERYALQQQLDGQGARLAAVDNGLYDVRGEICKPQEPADMRFAEAMAPRNLSGIGEFTSLQHAHP